MRAKAKYQTLHIWLKSKEIQTREAAVFFASCPPSDFRASSRSCDYNPRIRCYRVTFLHANNRLCSQQRKKQNVNFHHKSFVVGKQPQQQFSAVFGEMWDFQRGEHLWLFVVPCDEAGLNLFDHTIKLKIAGKSPGLCCHM